MDGKICYNCRSEVNISASLCPHCRSKLGKGMPGVIADKPLGFLKGCILICGGVFIVSIIIGIALDSFSKTRSSIQQENAKIEKQKREQDAISNWKLLPAIEHIKFAEELIRLNKKQNDWAKSSLGGKKGKFPGAKYVTKDEWDSAKTRLGLVDKTDKNYQKVNSLLDEMARIDKVNAIEAKQLEEKLSSDSRRDFAKRLDSSFLEQRMDTEVGVSGKNNTILTIKYVLSNKVIANDISKSGILEKAREAGFKKVKLTDGYDFGWSWDLTQ